MSKHFRDQIVTAAQVLTPNMVVEPFDTLECAFQAAMDIFHRPSQYELDRRMEDALERNHLATVAYNLRQGADRARLERRHEWRIDSLLAHNVPAESADNPAPRRARRKAVKKPARRAAAAKPAAKRKRARK